MEQQRRQVESMKQIEKKSNDSGMDDLINVD